MSQNRGASRIRFQDLLGLLYRGSQCRKLATRVHVCGSRQLETDFAGVIVGQEIRSDRRAAQIQLSILCSSRSAAAPADGACALPQRINLERSTRTRFHSLIPSWTIMIKRKKRGGKKSLKRSRVSARKLNPVLPYCPISC